MALETIIKNADAYLSTGNNYLLTDIASNSTKPFWIYSVSDFDVSVSFLSSVIDLIL
jgi:hypothetical protein